MMEKSNIKPNLIEALTPIIFLIVALSLGIIVLGVDPHIPLLLSTAVAALVAIKVGFKWKTIEDGIFKGINLALQAILILMIVGTLIGSWIEAGIVPTMIYYGLQILSPQIYLVAAFIICTIVALVVGSSWSTVGTIGIALIAIGEGLGVPVAMAGGAVVSGAYVGDKMSPLSDTTNLAPGTVGETNLFDHIRHMLYITIPAYVIALIIFAVLGFQFAGQVMDQGQISEILAAISEYFFISPILFIPPLLVIVLIAFKVPPIPGLLGGSVLGGIIALIFQGSGLGAVIESMHYGFSMDSGVELVDNLLSTGGLDGMMWTISLILVALSLGGVLERTKCLEVILEKVLTLVKSIGNLSLVTHLTAIFLNLVTADQYLSIVLTARMYKDAYKEMGYHPKNLSRSVEASGTLTSPLIPWNTCGAFMYGALGVNPLVYAPYAFFNWIAPLISITLGYTGYSMKKYDEPKNQTSSKAIED